MKHKLSNFVALDLGSNKIACVAAYVDPKGVAEIVSQNLHYSKGIKSGFILNLKEAENSILGAIYALEKECSKNVKKITISLTGCGAKSYYIDSKIKISRDAVTPLDIKKLTQKALSEFKIKNQEIIHCFPLEFTLDNNKIDDPIGMFGTELSCELHIVAVSADSLVNITNGFAKCHVEIANIILAVYASGIACLSDDERDLGSIIIDMGAMTTSFGVFLAGKLVYTSYIEIGSFHITSDIAKVFVISFAVAEKLKILYGNAVLSSLDRDKVINIEELEIDNHYISIPTITVRDLAEVINSRVEEVLLMIKAEYDRVISNQMIVRRVIVTGGGSMLRGVKEIAGRIFEKQVRIGKPQIIPGFAEGYNPSIYSAAIGMVKNHVLKQQKNFSDINDKDENGWFKNILIWLKENI